MPSPRLGSRARPVPALAPHGCTGARRGQGPFRLVPAQPACIPPAHGAGACSPRRSHAGSFHSLGHSLLSHTHPRAVCLHSPRQLWPGTGVARHHRRCCRKGGLSLHPHFQQLFKFKNQCAAREGVGGFYPAHGWGSCFPLAPLLLLEGGIANPSLGMHRWGSHRLHPCFWGVMGRQQDRLLSPCTPAIAGAAVGLSHCLTSNHLSVNSSCMADVPQTLIDPHGWGSPRLQEHSEPLMLVPKQG